MYASFLFPHTIRRRLKLLLLLAIPCVSIQAQIAGASPSRPIVIGRSEILHSGILGEDRRLLLYLPASFADNYFFPRRYPVLYLLDADSYFAPIAGLISHLSAAGGGSSFPEMIVVGIANTDRNRDLTPSRVSASDRMDSISASHTGGGPRFLDFIAHELMPYIDSAFPTAPYRVFLGHSLGGLTVINTLIHHPGLFNAYIATDPSMFWDDQRLLGEVKPALKKKLMDRTSLFLGIANSPRTDLPAGPFGADSTMIRLSHLHYRSILTLRDYLSSSSIRFSSGYYPAYDHSSSPLPAAYDGLRFVFDFYDLDFPGSKFFMPDFKKDSCIAAHYQSVSRQMGYTISPPEQFVNDLAYGLLARRQFDRAYRLFAMNLANYPGSFNVYDSMGDYYLATGDRFHAFLCFSQSLALRETAETREKLQNLQLAP